MAPFVTGSDQPALPRIGLPLDRLLPPYYYRMATQWVSQYAPPGSWILDPFGQDPFSILELARNGYRVLVTSNNPVPAFILEVLAAAPTPQEWGDVLLALANLPMQDGTRLEDFINSYYRLDCPNLDCDGGTAEINTLIWREAEPNPSLALISCPICGKHQELALTAEILAKLPPLPSFALHRARALELAAPLDDPLRPVMEEVVKYYSPQALVLFQIILNKLDHPSLTNRQKLLLKALLLTTADQVNQLWAYPLGRNRPRQLVRPPVNQEPNLWQAILRSKEQWSQPGEPVSFKYWPELPPQKGGISLFKGRLRELDPKPDKEMFGIVYSSLPRRNQAYWNLSGLWSGWLWGRESISALRNTLLRQRYDWTWHEKALSKVLGQLPQLSGPQTPILLQIGEVDTLFLLAGILASQDAGLKLNAFAMDGEQTTLQTIWSTAGTQTKEVNSEQLRTAGSKGAARYLAERGEPAQYLQVFSDMFLNLQFQGFLKGQPQKQVNGTLNELENELERGLTDPGVFVRFNPGISVDTGQYWLSRPPHTYLSLADRTEAIILSELQAHSPLVTESVTSVLNQNLRGLLTPEMELTTAILQSYADAQPDSGQLKWHLRSGEEQSARMGDIQFIKDLILKLAEQMNFKTRMTPESITWLDTTSQPVYTFFPVTTALFSQIVLPHQDEPGLKLIVLPGSRANLAAYKQKRDPNLQNLIRVGWHFVKYRQIRNLNENPLLSRELFASQITGDPPEFRASQMALF